MLSSLEAPKQYFRSFQHYVHESIIKLSLSFTIIIHFYFITFCHQNVSTHVNFLEISLFIGEIMCRLFPVLRYGLVAVSLFTILTITINRYIMIGHPRIYPRYVWNQISVLYVLYLMSVYVRHYYDRISF